MLGLRQKDVAKEQTLASLLRARRRELGLTHKEAAKVMDVSPYTILYWENEGKNPQPQLIPKIIAFLGCNLFQTTTTTIPGLLRAKRLALGFTQKEAATKLGVRTTAYLRWEHGHSVRTKKNHSAIAAFLGLSEGEILSVMGKG